MVGSGASTDPVIGSPGEVALKLLQLVAENEDRVLTASENSAVAEGKRGCDRAYILNTFAECLVAVSGHRELPK